MAIEDTTYRPVYESAIEELRRLMTELNSIEDRRDWLSKRIARVKKGIHGLAPLCDGVPWVTDPDLLPEIVNPQTGLSDAVWQVLSVNPVSGAYISPVTVREQLKNVGYQTKSENILPSIHNVLKR